MPNDPKRSPSPTSLSIWGNTEITLPIRQRERCGFLSLSSAESSETNSSFLPDDPFVSGFPTTCTDEEARNDQMADLYLFDNSGKDGEGKEQDMPEDNGNEAQLHHATALRGRPKHRKQQN